MATVPVFNTPSVPTVETVEEKFRRLEAMWMAEVGHFSSPRVICNHPAFKEIVRMGTAVIPSMLRDLDKGPRLWVWALREITGADPVPASDAGNIAKTGDAWLRWARENGFQW